MKDLVAGREERNIRFIAEATSTGENDLDRASYQKSLEEKACGVLRGPFTSLDEVGFDELFMMMSDIHH